MESGHRASGIRNRVLRRRESVLGSRIPHSIVTAEDAEARRTQRKDLWCPPHPSVGGEGQFNLSN